MNITKFINAHSELNELPFLVVYRTIQILQSIGVVKFTEENENGMAVVDELLEAVKVLQPRMYDGVLRRLSEI